jgi:hypothetical protein
VGIASAPKSKRTNSEEARVKAEQMADLSAIATRTLVAKHYDILAQNAEIRRNLTGDFVLYGFSCVRAAASGTLAGNTVLLGRLNKR